MEAQSDNHLDFVARIARIEGTAAASTQMLFVGTDEIYAIKRRARKIVASRGREIYGTFHYPVALVAAVALGALSHGIGQVLRFHIQGVPDLAANRDVDMLVQIVLGIVISMGLGFAVGLNARVFTILKSVGVICGVLFFHNAVHAFPRPFVALTSDLWVNQVLIHTVENAPMWRGIAFQL